MSGEDLNIRELLAQPETEANGIKALAWAKQQQDHAERGDLVLGIMTVETYESIPGALAYAGRCGLADAWLLLAQHHQTEGQELEADQALSQAVSVRPEVIVQQAEHRWFRLRDVLTPREAASTYQRLQSWYETHPQDGQAAYLLGLMTYGGFGTPARPARAVQWQEQAAAQGHPGALFELFILYSTGEGVSMDEQRAWKALCRAAEGGHTRAMYNLGAFYATGRGAAPLDMTQALVWYDRAAEADHAGAARTLALMYLTGQGVERNLYQGETYLNLAEELGLDMQPYRALLRDGSP